MKAKHYGDHPPWWAQLPEVYWVAARYRDSLRPWEPAEKFFGDRRKPQGDGP